MRIRIVQKPATASIDGVRLDTFEPGCCYDVGTTIGTLLLAEDWAEPATDERQGAAPAVYEMQDCPTPTNLQRDSSIRESVAVAADMSAAKTTTPPTRTRR